MEAGAPMAFSRGWPPSILPRSFTCSWQHGASPPAPRVRLLATVLLSFFRPIQLLRRCAAVLAALLLLLLILPIPPAYADGAASADLFDLHCAGCHPNGGNIIRRGKTLKLAALERRGLDSPQAIAQIVREGVGQMGSYETAVGPDAVDGLASWVWQQAQSDWS